MRTRATWAAGVAAVLVATLAVAGCGGTKQKTVEVFAAASLTGAFTTIGHDFEAAHPGTSVRFNFAGSSTLAAQIGQGAPADVFAAASTATMAPVAGRMRAAPVTFAHNQLVIAVPRGNPQHVRGLADLARPGITVALCAEQVPCGAAAAKALAAARVDVHPATLEQDVRAALAKVRVGEVDAALVYRTDARDAASDVDGVEFPQSAVAVTAYPIGVLRSAHEPDAARAFMDYVLSPTGRSVLAGAGFQQP